MLINASNLNALRVGYSTAYQSGLAQAASQFARVATQIAATQKEQKYGWLGKMPMVREWIGPRAVQNLMQHDYAIKEKAFELTIGVDRDDIETDNLGIYAPMFTEMGMSTGSQKDLLVFQALRNGFTTACYDGQNFFDANHPVIDADGSTINLISNSGGGAGTPWFLIDASRSLKPIILQMRKDFEFVAKDSLTDDNVFNNREFIYGADARMNVGYGFWQMSYGSRQTLNAASYAAARASMMGMKGDFGRPLGLMPRLLVVPPALESAAMKIVNSEYAAGGETNEWKGTAEVLVVPWLA